MITFYRAAIEDAISLLNVKIRAFAWDVKEYGMGPPNYDDLEDLTRAIEEAIYYKILFNEAIVGGFSLYDLGHRHFELGSIYIDPDCQGKGIGTKAIEYMEQSHPEIKIWTLDTPYKSFRNQHFYEKMGYIKTGEFKPEPLNDFVLFKYQKTIE